jgi:hypothetical protein
MLSLSLEIPTMGSPDSEERKWVFGDSAFEVQENWKNLGTDI